MEAGDVKSFINEISYEDVHEYCNNVLKNSDINIVLSANRDFYNKNEQEIQKLLANIFNASKNNV